MLIGGAIKGLKYLSIFLSLHLTQTEETCPVQRRRVEGKMVKKFMRATSEQVSTDEPFTFGKSVWNNLNTLTWTWKRDDVELLWSCGSWRSHIGHAVGGHGNDRLPVNNSPTLHAKLPCHKFIIIIDGGNFDRVNTEGCVLLDSFDMCLRLSLSELYCSSDEWPITDHVFILWFIHLS